MTADERVTRLRLKAGADVNVRTRAGRDRAGAVWWQAARRDSRASLTAGPPVVVLMDSPSRDRVYDPETLKNGGSNADDITDVLHDLPITLVKEATSRLWRRENEILKQHPALEGKIETWRVPLDRATFRNPLSGRELKDSVEKALGLKVVSPTSGR